MHLTLALSRTLSEQLIELSYAAGVLRNCRCSGGRAKHQHTAQQRYRCENPYETPSPHVFPLSAAPMMRHAREPRGCAECAQESRWLFRTLHVPPLSPRGPQTQGLESSSSLVNSFESHVRRPVAGGRPLLLVARARVARSGSCRCTRRSSVRWGGDLCPAAVLCGPSGRSGGRNRSALSPSPRVCPQAPVTPSSFRTAASGKGAQQRPVRAIRRPKSRPLWRMFFRRRPVMIGSGSAVEVPAPEIRNAESHQ